MIYLAVHADDNSDFFEVWYAIRETVSLQASFRSFIQNCISDSNQLQVIFDQTKSKSYSPSSTLLGASEQGISSGSMFAALLFLFDCICYCRQHRLYQQHLASLSYLDIVKQFPHVIIAEYHILRMQKLIHMAKDGSLPEQLYARIHLAQISLPIPYDKISKSCQRKLYKSNFDQKGNVLLEGNLSIDSCYKKFYEKIPQSWQQLVFDERKISKDVKITSFLNDTYLINNSYNQTVLDMIHAGIAEQFPKLYKLLQRSFSKLTKSLYDYYVQQRIRQWHSMLINDYDPVIANFCYFQCLQGQQQLTDDIHMRAGYYQLLHAWLFDKQQVPELLQEYKEKFHFESIGDKQDFDIVLYVRLLREFLDSVCFGQSVKVAYLDDFFTHSGILKKYQDHVFVKKYVSNIILQDSLMQKAANFSLAIVAVDNDEKTVSLATQILYHIVLAYQDADLFDMCYKKIVKFYEVLSYRQYDDYDKLFV